MNKIGKDLNLEKYAGNVAVITFVQNHGTQQRVNNGRTQKNNDKQNLYISHKTVNKTNYTHIPLLFHQFSGKLSHTAIHNRSKIIT